MICFWFMSICQVRLSTTIYISFVSLFSHFWLIRFSPTPALSTILRPLSSSMCPITPETAKVARSYNCRRGPGIGCWFSDRSNCIHWSFEATVLPINPNIYTDQWEPIVIYHSITFTGPCTTMQPTLLTSWYSHFSRWLGQLKYSPNQGWESTHRLHIYPLGGVFYSP